MFHVEFPNLPDLGRLTAVHSCTQEPVNVNSFISKHKQNSNEVLNINNMVLYYTDHEPPSC